MEECALRGTFVAAHAHGSEGIMRAVRAGARSIEHASLIDDEALALVVDRGTYLVIDISDGDWMIEQGPALGYSDEAHGESSPAGMIDLRRAADLQCPRR